MAYDIAKVINDLQPKFNQLSEDHMAVKFERECLFARQILNGSDYLTKVAQNNIGSLEAAVLNVASIGISLNPASKHAYLVPRKGMVCLDVSYMGLCHLAQEVGSIRWVQAQIVHKADEFTLKGMGERPIHNFSPFGDRGEMVGVYVVAKTSDGDFLTHWMTIEDVYSIRDRSEAWKAGRSCPWKTDEKEMIKKTVVKQASKMWPKSERTIRLDTAIHEVNQHEGIDFEAENEAPSIELIDYKKKDELIDRIKIALSEKTKNLNLQQKGTFLVEKVGIKSFKELSSFQPEKLEKVLVDIGLIESVISEEKEGFTVEDMPF